MCPSSGLWGGSWIAITSYHPVSTIIRRAPTLTIYDRVFLSPPWPHTCTLWRWGRNQWGSDQGRTLGTRAQSPIDQPHLVAWPGRKTLNQGCAVPLDLFFLPATRRFLPREDYLICPVVLDLTCQTRVSTDRFRFCHRIRPPGWNGKHDDLHIILRYNLVQLHNSFGCQSCAYKKLQQGGLVE